MDEKSAKRPISVTLDPDLLQELQELVAEGKTASVSAWLNETARSRMERDQLATRARAYVEENLLGGRQLTDGELVEAEGMLAASIARTGARRSARRGTAA